MRNGCRSQGGEIGPKEGNPAGLEPGWVSSDFVVRIDLEGEMQAHRDGARTADRAGDGAEIGSVVGATSGNCID